MGRPTLYTPELAALICERMSRGLSLRQVCRSDDIPVDEVTVRGWAIQDVEGFSAPYAVAREAQMDAWADEILEVSDDGSNDWLDRELRDGRIERVVDTEHINRSRLRVDARKWIMSKIAPKKYGDKIQTEHSGSIGVRHEDALQALK